MQWVSARAAAAGCAPPLPGRRVPLSAAAGAVLADDVHAPGDLPAADTSAMDGWAVAGPPPWTVRGEVLAGSLPAPLPAGDAVRIATGALLPPGAGGVLRRERGTESGGVLRPLDDPGYDVPGAVAGDVRRAGRECRRGDVVLPAGSRLTPAAVGLLAAVGADEVAVRRARVAVLVLGDELVVDGVPRAGTVRDALGPMLAAWLPALGAGVVAVRRVPDRHDALAAVVSAVAGADQGPVDVVVTTGSTARGPVDHLHAVLEGCGARLVVDGVAVRPGHPQLLALLPRPDGGTVPLVGLPGNPLAAVSAVLTLLEPLLAAMHAGPPRPVRRVRLLEAVAAGGEATRLVPVLAGRPVRYAGPAMLRGLAGADGVAVVPPRGLPAGAETDVLDLPGSARS